MKKSIKEVHLDIISIEFHLLHCEIPQLFILYFKARLNNYVHGILLKTQDPILFSQIVHEALWSFLDIFVQKLQFYCLLS